MALMVVCGAGKGHPPYIQGDVYKDWPTSAPRCPKCFEEWKALKDRFKPIIIETYNGEFPGCFNLSADALPRTNKAWSDTNLNIDYSQKTDWIKNEFIRLKCRHCGNISFEVLQTGDYETSAKCYSCGMYYIVHCG